MAKSTARIGRLPAAIAMVVVLGLLAAHLGIGYYMLSHARLALGLSGAAIVLVVVKHVGLVGGLLARLRRRRMNRHPEAPGAICEPSAVASGVSAGHASSSDRDAL